MAHSNPLDPSNIAAEYIPDVFTQLQSYFTRSNTGPLGVASRANFARILAAEPMALDKRLEHISVLCAANTIAMVFLLGVVVLQVGEWWVAETVIKPLEVEAERLARTATAVQPAVVDAAEKKNQ